MNENQSVAINVTPDPVVFWKIRAAFGDVELRNTEVIAASAALQRAIATRTELLKNATGDEVNIDRIMSVQWNDELGTLTFVLATP